MITLEKARQKLGYKLISQKVTRKESFPDVVKKRIKTISFGKETLFFLRKLSVHSHIVFCLFASCKSFCFGRYPYTAQCYVFIFFC